MARGSKKPIADSIGLQTRCIDSSAVLVVLLAIVSLLLGACKASPGGGSGGGGGGGGGGLPGGISIPGGNGEVTGIPLVVTPAVSPHTTNTSSLTIEGRCDNGYAVSLIGDGPTRVAMCNDNEFDFTVNRTSDGTYNFSLLQTSPALVESSPVPVVWTRDTGGPSAPTITQPPTTPYSSSDTDLVISGGCEAGATVNLAGDATDSVVCQSAGTYSFTVNRFVDATYNFMVSQTDTANNTSSPTALQWVRITSLPPTPTVLSPSPSPYYSNQSSLVISGGCVSGNTVNLAGDETQNMVCTAAPSSSYSFTVNRSTDGTYNFTVTQTDALNNTSAAAQAAWIRDTASPLAVTITAPVTNPHVSSGSSLALSGACEDGATVNLTGASTASTTCANSAYSFNLSQSSDGTFNYSIIQTDRAGNPSAAEAFQWIRDTSAPATPTIASPATSPYYSNSVSATSVISGICTTGLSVTLSGNEAQTTTCATSSYSFTVSTPTDGTYNFYVRQTSASGIDSAQASLVFIRDTAAPAAPIIVAPAASPYTSAGNLSLNGTCEADATVNLSGDDAQSTTCAAGAFSFTVSEADGTHNYSVSQTDRAGNASAASTQQWIRDSVAPSNPTVTSPASSPFRSNGASVTIAGACQGSNTVTLSGDVIASEVTTPANQLTTACSGSAYSFIVSKSVDGTFDFSVHQTGTNGIDSGLVNTQWIRDTLEPDTTIATGPASPNASRIAEFVFSSNESSVTFECRLDAAAYAPCTSPHTITAPANGARTFSVRAIDGAGNIESSPATHAWTQQAYNAVALYHFDATPGLLVDSGSYTGANNNALTNNNTATSNSTARFGQSVLFNGTSQFLSKTTSSSLSAARRQLTVEAWVRFSSLPSAGQYRTIASKSGAAGQRSWEFKITRTGSNYYLVLVGSLDGTNIVTVTSTALPSPGTANFRHLAVTFNQGAVAFYYNGTQQGTGTIGTVGSAQLFDSNASLRIARSEAGEYLAGRVDEVRISQIVRWSTSFTAPSTAYVAD
ncbi:MAG: Ig-like domain-containing protein [Bdellovibrionota bacterium]